MIIPKLLSSKGVNYFLADKIGEGFKNSLYANGIFTIIRKKIDRKNIKEIINV
jgi:predicted Fe-Mo cluster-binding NifX family protein